MKNGAESARPTTIVGMALRERQQIHERRAWTASSGNGPAGRSCRAVPVVRIQLNQLVSPSQARLYQGFSGSAAAAAAAAAPAGGVPVTTQASSPGATTW